VSRVLAASRRTLDANVDFDAATYALGHDAEVLERRKAVLENGMIGWELRVEGHIDLPDAEPSRLGANDLDVDVRGDTWRQDVRLLQAKNETGGEAVADCSRENTSRVGRYVAPERSWLIHAQRQELLLVEPDEKLEPLDLLHVDPEAARQRIRAHGAAGPSLGLMANLGLRGCNDRALALPPLRVERTEGPWDGRRRPGQAKSPGVDPTDEALLTALRSGDERALGALLERHLPAVYRFGVKMCSDPEDAKDVAQETLLAAARGLREFRGASSLSTWLFAIARSFCIKKRRRRVGEPGELVSIDAEDARGMAAAGTAPDEVAGDREMGAALDAAIRDLEPMYREVLVLRDVDGLKADEVARVLGVSVDAVKSRLHRARIAVRARLAPLLNPSEVPVAPGCPDLIPFLSQYLEGDIGPDQCASMEQHVAECPRCRARCDSLRSTLALCRRSLKRGSVPPEVQEAVRQALREQVFSGP
jgi:RNA polymerase sigma-70 factor, ECF subfamily